MDHDNDQQGAGVVTIDVDKLKRRAEELEDISKETGLGIVFIQAYYNGLTLEENNRMLRNILTLEIDIANTDAENARQRAGLLKKITPPKPEQDASKGEGAAE